MPESVGNTVFVPMPPGMTYADGMGHLRAWLDAKRIDVSSFKITADARVGFEITFPSERDVVEFQLFDWPR